MEDMRISSSPLEMSTGDVMSGTSGAISLTTGSASLDDGRAGTVSIRAGSSGLDQYHSGVVSTAEGGIVNITSGGEILI